MSLHTYDSIGESYNISKILNAESSDMNIDSYENYNKLYLSISLAFTYGWSFVSFTATIIDVVIFHREEILQMLRKAITDLEEQFEMSIQES